MATYAANTTGHPFSSLPAWAGEQRYVARQPILDLNGHVHGYELLFRSTADAVLNPDLAAKAGSDLKPAVSSTPVKASRPTADVAARTMLDNAVIFGLEWLTNGLPAFVRCSLETLNEDLVLVLAPEKTVLQIPAGLELTPKLLDSCRKLKARGFRLALEDFNWSPEWRPLAKLAEYIRVDFNRFTSSERQYLQSLQGPSPAMVAKNVETQEDYQTACAEGFTLFQGSYFCHPVLLKKQKLPANRLLHFDIVRQLHHDPIDIRRVSQLMLRDPSLTYRLLRMANSPIYAIQQEVRSIESAILIIGENGFRRMVSLAVLTEFSNEAPPEILQMALVRARFCELASRLCGLDSSEQYLLGMFSLVPAMLRLPMEELTPSLPLRAEIREALQGTPNPERILLGWLESYERGDWTMVDAIMESKSVRQEKLLQCYADSVVWARTALSSTS